VCALLTDRVARYLAALTSHPDRHLGGPGNRAATDLFARVAAESGFDIASVELDCIEWRRGNAAVEIGDRTVPIHSGPYSLPCAVTAPLAAAATIEALESGAFAGQVLLLHGTLAREQLMPKRFPFYNPPEHGRIIAAVEAQAPAAVIAATSRNPDLAGGLYPFPLFEDGDFDIPNAYLTDVDGAALLPHVGQPARLHIDSGRNRARAAQPIAGKGAGTGTRVVAFAHIDSKEGTPGALDNATGVCALLVLMELLADYVGPHRPRDRAPQRRGPLRGHRAPALRRSQRGSVGRHSPGAQPGRRRVRRRRDRRLAVRLPQAHCGQCAHGHGAPWVHGGRAVAPGRPLAVRPARRPGRGCRINLYTCTPRH